MENEVVQAEENFGMEIIKAFALSAAATAGILTGASLVAAVQIRLSNRRKTRTTENAQEEN